MDPYEVLGVSRTAPDSVIKAAFRARIRETHPDAGGDPALAQQVNDAYATLSDPDRRAQVPPLAPEPAPYAPAEPRERTDAPAASQAPPAVVPADEEPYLVYTDDRDRRPLWKRRTAWIPVAAAIVIGAGTGGPIGAAAALAASGILLMRWSPKVIAIAYLVVAAPTLITIGTGSTLSLPEIIPGAVAVAALTPVLMVWAAIRRRIRKTDAEHAQDIFVTTRDRFRLEEVTVLELFAGVAGERLARVAGHGVRTIALAPSSFPIDVGDRALIHQEQPLYAVSAR